MIDGWMDQWIGRWMIDLWIDGWFDWWIDQCIDGLMDEWIDWSMHWWMDRSIDRSMDRSIIGLIDWIIDGWMDQWMDGWIDQMIYESDPYRLSTGILVYIYMRSLFQSARLGWRCPPSRTNSSIPKKTRISVGQPIRIRSRDRPRWQYLFEEGRYCCRSSQWRPGGSKKMGEM